ncbi:hypothetical protein ANCDUO_22751 [Ancylostoma duodenale]|uniref:Uncharacterized protein n=1 Tax=Ancylostoma duodenale TaxID=51022 RepID=A0A0C2BTF4_9BILA|nr:hypothetical protein ANCDUO_22751 [Ancylostoma duodenale]
MVRWDALLQKEWSGSVSATSQSEFIGISLADLIRWRPRCKVRGRIQSCRSCPEEWMSSVAAFVCCANERATCGSPAVGLHHRLLFIYVNALTASVALAQIEMIAPALEVRSDISSTQHHI